MTSVLIATGQSLQRVGLRMLLESQPDLTVVGEATHGPEAVRLSALLRPDVVLLDGRTTDTDTVETVRRLVHTPDAPAPHVLLLTTGDDTYPYGALRAGAAGHLPEDATADELVAAVRVVAAGDVVVSPGLTRALIDAVRSGRTVDGSVPGSRLDTLTGRERDVLTAVASGDSNAEIADRLSIAPTTVKSHVSNILTKIGARGRVQAVVFAYESGLVRPTQHVLHA
ncbi:MULTISPECIES: response regulator transcription factor [unclassified Streptomyces]|jgi:DNA-binding NarL/FixJ family response regulator|uniref:response regulator transcription factor n=1 Tax=unclassified Streptomyces TaxID=2593676 RepID=UPI000F4E4085|nr:MULTISPECIES: response regulator transcription factor [unclassified Streptomyces]MDH6454839.1 DNA-binding NarL/FixJ family response regulator [Streptomyces sp. SAI-119]MDH6494607.1 DNA-binding NarL/FixJ family response regulator [Streptomyces sp. SAI-149]